MATSARSALIEQVIAARRPLADRIAAARSALDDLREALLRLDLERGRVLSELEGPSAKGVVARLQSLDLGRLVLGLEERRQALSRLEARFRRERLAVGVVGRARQGKSRLLQTLTGLGAREIPDGDRTHCTGVRSTIIHRPEVEPHAEVWLHTERSFLDEVIAPYYAELPELGAPPRTLAEWRAAGPPRAKARLLGSEGAKLAHLTRAFSSLDQFAPLLGAASPRRIPLGEVRRWVAQTSPDGENPYYQHLAVREVKMASSFPHEDVARMQVIDMPGLGDTGVGDEARLIATLGHEVDAVLFVRMPKPLGDHWADVDVALYDLARRALPELPLERWAFFVLNRTRAGTKQGDNLKNCEDLRSDASRQGLAAVRCAIVDCSDRREVELEILDPLLEYVAAHVERLDRDYASMAEQQLRDFVEEARTILEEAERAIAREGGGDRENPLFRRLFDTIWEELAGLLEGYLARLQRRRREEDPDLALQIAAALDASRERPPIPDLETIERRRHARGSYAIAYNELLHEVRTELSRCFLRLDDGLKRSLLAVKEGVGEVMRGPLGQVSEDTGLPFLRALRQRLPPESPGLAEGFDMLLDFDLSYRGLIQHRIRRHLDGLTPDLTSLQLSTRPDAAEVRAYLDTLYREAIYEAEHGLRGLLYEPNQAAFAMVEEFVDRVLRARGARTEWDLFLFEIRSEVWRGEFDRLEARTRTRRRWEEAARAARSAASTPAFRFLESHAAQDRGP